MHHSSDVPETSHRPGEGRARLLLVGADVVTGAHAPTGSDRRPGDGPANPAVLRAGWALVEHGRVAAVGSGDPPPADDVVDLADHWLAPGFVDVHAHGGGGASFQGGDPAQVRRVVDTHRRRGTTTMLASLVSAPVDELTESLSRLRALHREGLVAGAHLEGPFLSPARAGVHDPAALRPPDTVTVAKLVDAGGGALRMVTLAPELEGGPAAVRQLVAAGVVVAVGHTDADFETVRRAVGDGARVATHLFNAMPPLLHREPGPVAALLEDPRVVVELIADGHHLDPAVLRMVARLLGPDRLALVSDAIAAAGCGDGRYEVAGRPVDVRDGQAVLAGAPATAAGDPPTASATASPTLAGSTITLADAVRTAVEAGLDPVASIRAATCVPARALGLGQTAGVLAPGGPADLVVLDRSLQVQRVMKHGAWLS